MPQFTVQLQGGGSVVVNAKDAQSAMGNVGGGASSVQSGAHYDAPAPAQNSYVSPAASSPAPTQTQSQSNGVVGLGSLTATDGQTLSNQSPDAKATYRAVYGDRAEQQWVLDHNAALGTSAPANYGSNGQATPAAQGQGNSGPAPVSQTVNAAGNSGMNAAVQQLGTQINAMMSAIQSGNKAAFDESVRQFNQNFGLAVGGLTGSYGGQPTLAAQNQTFQQGIAAANLTGTYNGQQTQAAQQQQFTQQLQQAQQALAEAGVTGTYKGAQTQQAILQQANIQNQQNQTGLSALQLAGSLHADPFRQMEVEYGIANNPGISHALNGLTGEGGVGSLPKFTPGQGSAASTATIPGLAGLIQNAGGGPTTTQQSLLTSLKSPTNVIARNYATADKNTQDMVTSAISANTGLDQATIHQQIMSQLPSVTSPTFGMATI